MKRLYIITSLLLCMLFLCGCAETSGQSDPAKETTLEEQTTKDPSTTETTQEPYIWNEKTGRGQYDDGVINKHEYMDPIGSYFAYEIFMGYINEDSTFYWVREHGRYDWTDQRMIDEFNVYHYVRDFHIPREVFEDCYNYMGYYTCDFNIDLIYNGTLEEYKEYYKNWRDHYVDVCKRSNEGQFKQKLFMYVSQGKIIEGRTDEALYQEVKNWASDCAKKLNCPYLDIKYYDVILRAFSIPEILYRYDIPRADAEAALENVLSYSIVMNHYDYDFDLIYNNRETVEGWIATKTPMEVDELIRK